MHRSALYAEEICMQYKVLFRHPPFLGRWMSVLLTVYLKQSLTCILSRKRKKCIRTRINGSQGPLLSLLSIGTTICIARRRSRKLWRGQMKMRVLGSILLSSLQLLIKHFPSWTSATSDKLGVLLEIILDSRFGRSIWKIKCFSVLFVVGLFHFSPLRCHADLLIVMNN